MNSASEGDLFSEGLILVDLLASFIATNGVNIATGFSIAQNLFKSKVVSIETHSEFILFSSEDAIFSFLTSNSYPRGDYVSRLVASRICRSIEQINLQGGVIFIRQLRGASGSNIRSLLLPLYGVGDKFICTYFLLAGIGEF